MTPEKRVFFFLNDLRIGGVQKAALSLLSTLDFRSTEVHLCLYTKTGELLSSVPEQVIIETIPIDEEFTRLRLASPYDSFKRMMKLSRITDAFVVLFLHILYKINPSNRYFFYKYFARKTPSHGIVFDEAHAFYGIDEFQDYYLRDKIYANKKYCWIHNDVSRESINNAFFLKMMASFDQILLVSRQAKDIFDSVFPSLRPKSSIRMNIIPREQILSMAKNGASFRDGFNGIRLLTTGRISVEKGQRDALLALKILLRKGFPVKWYFIGDGPDKDYCTKQARDTGISDAATFLGGTTNPYGYLRDCDIYVQPSRYEGYCISLAEALIFGKPVVATDFAGAREQLEGKSSFVITSNDPQQIAEGIVSLIETGNHRK